MGVVVLQIALGAAMVLLVFPPVLRSAHQATGIALWLTTFVTAYLARIAAGATTPAFALPHRPAPDVSTPTDQLPLLAMERGR
jgi:heme A synthase